MVNGCPGCIGYGWGWGGMLLWWLLWLVIIGLIVWFVIEMLRRREVGTRDPMDILNARYARGEISKKEYDQIRRELTQKARKRRVRE